ncbi:MAG: YjaG family protein [Aggregatibacter sp.]|jgi:glutamine--fructose-6-phosphate transaminase (isomerizing)|uniref:YjaG family protein n=1 Tax=Aggregatibacter sp. TaxID=1872413 RepID=UPI00360979DA
MRNPIHKRLENLATWQHLTFMACLCERMYPNYHLFCEITEQPQNAKVYHNILNLVWEYLTVKEANINFENQLEKLENIIPDVNDYDFYGVVPALDACEGLAEVLHTIIAGASLEQAVKVSQLSLGTVAGYLETEYDRTLSEVELKESDLIQQELDVQWQLYRALKEAERHDVELISDLKNALREEAVSNICIKIER